MPYINKYSRPKIDTWFEGAPDFEGPGELAYAEFKLWRKARANFSHFGGFFAFALVFGTIALTLLEWFRRDVAPYEDQRRVINGEVY